MHIDTHGEMFFSQGTELEQQAHLGVNRAINNLGINHGYDRLTDGHLSTTKIAMIACFGVQLIWILVVLCLSHKKVKERKYVLDG